MSVWMINFLGRFSFIWFGCKRWQNCTFIWQNKNKLDTKIMIIQEDVVWTYYTINQQWVQKYFNTSTKFLVGRLNNKLGENWSAHRTFQLGALPKIAPLPLFVSLHQHAWLPSRWRRDTFWRVWLAPHRFRCLREDVSGRFFKWPVCD